MRINQKVLTMSCLKIILILQHLLFWQKNYLKQKDEIEKMSEEKKETEKPDKILKTVEEILEFNKKIQKQLGLGLKILTPDQMLSSLPITLVQLKAGNDSEKLKNEIRQLLYFLYRSKKLTKQLYKYLADII